MCFSIALTKKAILSSNSFFKKLCNMDDFKSKYFVNAFTFPSHPVITSEDTGKIITFQWGLIPHWTKSKTDALKIRQYNINARSETAFEKPSFKKSIQTKRCLVPVSGFFEWQEFNKKKYPYYITLKQDDIFMLGGIYDNWTDQETGEIIGTFSILTTEANPMMSRIHNTKQRMPVIITKEREMDWVNSKILPDEIKSFFSPFSENDMKAHTVSKLISSKKQNPDIPEAIEPFHYPELEDKTLF